MSAELHAMSGPPDDQFGDFGDKVGPEPPVNYEAEQSLLAGLLLRNRWYDDAAEAGLEAKHFADDLHARIFEAIARLIEEGKAASAVTLAPFFSAEEANPGQPVRAYLVELQGAALGYNNTKDYCAALIDLWRRREGLYLFDGVADALCNPDVEQSASDILEEAAGQIMELHDGPLAQGGVKSLADAMDGWIVNVEAAHKAGGVLGVSSGFTDIDAVLGGLVKGDLIILAGRPKMGKSALAMNISTNVARAGGNVLFSSYEMSDEQLAGRVLAGETGVPVTAMRRGNVNSYQFDQIFEARRALGDLPLSLESPRIKTVAALRARARRHKRKSGLGLIVVDYLQLMQAPAHVRQRYEEVSAITRDLKALAIGLDVPVIALSQLSRKVEDRDDKRPMLSDLRESGSIEQDADIVAFVYREHEYIKNAAPKKKERESEGDFQARNTAWEYRLLDLAGFAELLIRANRHGPTADVKLGFDGPRMLFRNAEARLV